MIGYLYGVGCALLGVWIGSRLAARRMAHKLLPTVTSQRMDTTPPTRAEIDLRCPNCDNYPDTPGHHYGCKPKAPNPSNIRAQTWASPELGAGDWA